MPGRWAWLTLQQLLAPNLTREPFRRPISPSPAGEARGCHAAQGGTPPTRGLGKGGAEVVGVAAEADCRPARAMCVRGGLAAREAPSTRACTRRSVAETGVRSREAVAQTLLLWSLVRWRRASQGPFSWVRSTTPRPLCELCHGVQRRLLACGPSIRCAPSRATAASLSLMWFRPRCATRHSHA